MCIEYIEYIYMIYCDIYILFVIGMSEWSPRRRNFQNHLLSVLSPRRSAMPWLKHKCTHLYSDRIRIDTDGPIPYWCHGLEVYPGSCAGLPPRSLLFHPGHQRSQFTPLIGIEVTLCSFCSYLHNTGPCIIGGWPLCVEWAS